MLLVCPDSPDRFVKDIGNLLVCQPVAILLGYTYLRVAQVLHQRILVTSTVYLLRLSFTSQSQLLRMSSRRSLLTTVITELLCSMGNEATPPIPILRSSPEIGFFLTSVIRFII